MDNKTKNEALKQQRMEETREALADIKARRLIDGTEVMDWLERWGNDDEKASRGV